MKKSALLIAALAFGATSAFAQLENKKGEAYLPEAGDYAIGFDAAPFLQYFGNALNGTSGQGAFSGAWTNPYGMITGKMYASETMAYRGMIRLGFGSNKWTMPVVDDASTSTPPAMKDDELKSSYNFIGLGAGVEMRRGKGRLQGYYGGQFMFMFGGQKDAFTYGNAFSTSDPTPTTTDFQAAGAISYTNTVPGSRITEWKSGSMMGIGLRGFIGAEYFILPKVSLGAEYGWGLALSTQGASSTTVESWNGTGTTTTTTDGGKASSFAIDTDNNAFGAGASGSILVHFHF